MTQTQLFDVGNIWTPQNLSGANPMNMEKQLAKIMLDESCYLEMLANKLIANVRPGHVEYVSKSDEYVSKSDAAVALLRVVKSLRESATGI